MRFQKAATPLAVLGLAVAMGIIGAAQPGTAAAAAPISAIVPTGEIAPDLTNPPAIDSIATHRQAVEPYRLEIGGHRAGPDQAPENTLAALRKAIAEGADSVEMDVRFTADGTPIILHDDTLERTTDCTGFVADWKLTAVLRCDAGAWFNQAFSDQRVPTVEEVLDVMDTTDLTLYLHVKLADTLAQAATLVSTVATSRMKQENVIFVADEKQRLEMLALAGVPNDRLAWVVHRLSDFSDKHPRWGALVVHCPKLTPEMVEHVHARGQRIISVEGFPLSLEEAVALRLDGILADNLKAALASRAG